MNALKAYASRALNRMVLEDGPDRRRWAHHGSTRHLWTKGALSAAVRYVVCEQGEPMEVWELPMVQDQKATPERSRFRVEALHGA